MSNEIRINRVTAGQHRVGRGWQAGIVHGLVDGYVVTFTQNHGWRCRCLIDGCDHIGPLEAVIALDILTRIREGRRGGADHDSPNCPATL